MFTFLKLLVLSFTLAKSQHNLKNIVHSFNHNLPIHGRRVYCVKCFVCKTVNINHTITKMIMESTWFRTPPDPKTENRIYLGPIIKTVRTFGKTHPIMERYTKYYPIRRKSSINWCTCLINRNVVGSIPHRIYGNFLNLEQISYVNVLLFYTISFESDLMSDWIMIALEL